ncbi:MULTISPECIES: phosphonate ABC transporter, permease protein PhnE [Marivita]|uniref:Phosphonate ABC transporter, permease protein PhnE n=1 Tax=Marivita cryptomonadis TaxID=505252 RepID=A0A9Q2S2L6_9RHOB|nr:MULTISPECIES: phosphonate ABC transporter, permease protein PhnE [Marivita]MCR9167367.1 phosphonate ABC transporter, permease protein PhnE [Paracoccaceae bacterium]MBM2322486.1 phosphonate ABC transporter, permease protein PhnE [Marivita cryptomonadis]MBM2332068.1 phosphonate ABC transporter, permease protein PhnE [Marivita cryptomonadis]MBM2341652.1 phosphonate ABC transporter, permease protein PhnE [Marivita cryptomonadis]MBM2346316.1 phosphonate ABC transporter, permease protein PhnE [Ma
MTDLSPARLERPSAVSFLGYTLGLVIVFWCLAGAGFSIDKVMSSPPRFADFASRAFPPNMDPQVLARLGWKMVETLQIAVAGAVIGVILSVPIALVAARGLIAGPAVNQIVRTLLGFIRAVPEIAWALVFVVAVGLGPFAGMLAIVVDTIGFCGRFFADDMEGTDKGPAESLTATGARKIDVVACATIPAAMPAFISTGLFALEKAVRSSTILGLVGAGGIGIELKVGFDLFDYPTAMTVILMIAVVVIAIEQLSGWARIRIIGDQQ